MIFYAQRHCNDHGNARHQKEHMQSSDTSIYSVTSNLGKPSFKKSAVFFNIVQKAFGPPPFVLYKIYNIIFEHGFDPPPFEQC